MTTATAARPDHADAGQAKAHRLAALAALEQPDDERDTRFDDIVAAARAVCEMPIALVSIVGEHRQEFRARIGIDATGSHVDTSVCSLAMERPGAIFQIEDLAADERTRDFSLVTGPPHLRFYAGFPIALENGVVLGTVCVADTAARSGGLTGAQALTLEALARQAALEIERSAHLRLPGGILAAASLGAWDWDLAHDRVTADAGFAALHGVAPARAAAGAPVAEFFAGIHADDLSRVRAAVARSIADNLPFEQEYRLVHGGAKPRWVIAQGRTACAPDGTPVRLQGISFDIDERKRTELRLAALVEINDRLARVTDPADVAFAVSEVLGRVLDATRVGYGRIDSHAETIVIESNWLAPGLDAWPPLIRFRDFGSFIDDLKRGDGVVIDDTSTDPRTTGFDRAFAALSIRSIVNLPIIEHGAFVALLFINDSVARHWTEAEVSFVRDVAERTRDAVERRRAEFDLAALTASLEQQVEARTAALMLAEEQLRQAHKMEAVGQLTGGLAHDFNNLLAGISGALEMMQVRVSQGRIGDLDRYLTAAQGAARRAAALTHRLLAFSRRQTLDPKPTDVNRLILGMEELVRRTVGPAIALEVVGTAGAWPALVDPNQLENALLNLCINARDAMPDGGRITIETANKWLDERAARERDLPPGQYLSMSVSDTGAGMPPEVQARAFDPFYTTKPMGEGTGLGLSMIYGFARQSGGQVRIYSEVGAGTTLCIYLPRHYGEGDAPVEEHGTGLDRIGTADGSRVVLVVDDEPMIRMLVVEVLEELGYATLEAGDGAAALRILQSGTRIDLLVTDVGLPGQMNGRQVADAAQTLIAGLKVLFITGYAENAVIGSGQLAPGMALVTKPFAIDVLASRVGELLG
ncbi:ATP-binding protein [Sphingomonas bacterium]|uniref:ATP-binding protein n=1 Tax=Sphingomonas bacterium TaxID=1895847 RepID=UPI001576F98C|nr:ATP-binding protein [Sphingomonas bacterium]